MRRSIFSTIVLSAALIGCGGSAHPGRPLPGPRVADDATNPCPTQVEDAQVRSEIINGGVALVFYATNSDQIGAVRTRVHALAAANPTGDAAVKLVVLDTSDGARLELYPNDQDPDRLSDLRDRVADLADAMNGGECVTRVAERGNT